MKMFRFFLFLFGLLLLPSIALAFQYPSSFVVTCNANGAGICTSGTGPFSSTQVTGQAFTITGNVTSTNFTFTWQMCISKTSSGGTGICANYSTNSGSHSISIPAGDTTPYRWGVVTVNITTGPTVINGNLTVTGREVTLISVNDAPDPIQPNQSSVITYSGSDAWSGSITCTHPDAANCSFGAVPVNAGSRTYVNNGSTGIANYTVAFSGPDQTGGPTTKTLSGTITVKNPPPVVDLKCNGINGPCTVPYDGSVTLSWTSSSTTTPYTCVGNWPAPNTSKTHNSSELVNNITSTTVFTLTCTSADGQTNDSVTVNNPAGPTVNLRCATAAGGPFSAGPCIIASGSPGWVRWNITAGGDGTTSCQTTQGQLWTDAPAPDPRPLLPPQTESTSPMSIATDTLGIKCRNSTSGWGNTALVTLNRTNTPPVVSGVTVTEPDYCTAGLGKTKVSWTYTDPDSDDQATYQLQVDNNATDTDFTSPEIDTTQSLAATSGSTPSVQIGVSLQWNTRYHARIRATDIVGGVSPWTRMSVCVGPDCDGATPQRHWNTPVHKYPQTITITATPLPAALNEPIQFSTGAVCYNASNTPIACTAWNWTFGDGNGDTVAAPTHAYTASGSYTVNLQVTDNQSHVCTVPPASLVIDFGSSASASLPQYKEVLPH